MYHMSFPIIVSLSSLSLSSQSDVGHAPHHPKIKYKMTLPRVLVPGVVRSLNNTHSPPLDWAPLPHHVHLLLPTFVHIEAVCMYVCMYGWMYVCMYVCLYYERYACVTW